MTQVTGSIKTEGRGTDHEKTYDRKIQVDYDFHSKDLDAKIKAWGADVVDVLAERAGVVALRNQLTNYIRQEKSDEEVDELMVSWTPPLGPIRSKKTQLQKATEAAKGMNADELKELMKELKKVQPAE